MSGDANPLLAFYFQSSASRYTDLGVHQRLLGDKRTSDPELLSLSRMRGRQGACEILCKFRSRCDDANDTGVEAWVPLTSLQGNEKYNKILAGYRYRDAFEDAYVEESDDDEEGGSKGGGGRKSKKLLEGICLRKYKTPTT